jgi:F-type H+-transporting ATPase subunit c
MPCIPATKVRTFIETSNIIVRRHIMEGDLAHIGAGLAAIGSGAAAIGVGNVAGNFLSGALRNPSAAASQTATLFIGIAFAEALGIFSFLVALLLMFAV